MLEILEFGNKFAVGIFDIYIIVRLLNAIFKGKLYDKRFLYFVILLDIIVLIMLGYYAPNLCYSWYKYFNRSVRNDNCVAYRERRFEFFV